jgi:LTXXQ motif family protein
MAYGHMHMGMMRLSPKERCLELVAHVAGLVAYIEVRLDLTPEQRPLWDTLKGAAQTGIEKQRQVCGSVGAEDHPPTVLDREARAEQFLAARLALLQSTRPALEALYKALSPEQRALLDRPWPHGHF